MAVSEVCTSIPTIFTETASLFSPMKVAQTAHSGGCYDKKIVVRAEDGQLWMRKMAKSTISPNHTVHFKWPLRCHSQTTLPRRHYPDDITQTRRRNPDDTTQTTQTTQSRTTQP